MNAMTKTGLPASSMLAGPEASDVWRSVAREEEGNDVSLAGPTILGMLTILLGFGGFFLWAMLTPIAQASVASGRIIVESNTKTVTHLEGGTLFAIQVKEGDSVAEGQVLASLDVTRSQAMLTRISEQLFAMQIKLERLVAERDRIAVFRPSGLAADHVSPQQAARIIANELAVFAERGKVLEDLVGMDRFQIEQIGSQRKALQARQDALLLQIELVRKQHSVIENLASKHLATGTSASDRKIYLVDLESRLDETRSHIAENAQRITQLEMLLNSRRTERQRDVAEQLQFTQGEINRLTQEQIQTADIVAKSAIRAPIAGTVSSIRIRTLGSAILAGQPLMDIVPANQPLMVEGKARAVDIDSLRLGDDAEIRLTAFSAMSMEPLIGKIVYIAPDSVVDERNGDITFAFKAAISDAEMKRHPGQFLVAGMSADVYIINGQRTALAYLLDPVRKSFSRAFREQ